MASRRLRILFVSAEVAPFAKVGGLADVAGALPKALAALGHDVRIAMPGYGLVVRSGEWPIEDVLSSVPVHLGGGRALEARVRQTWIPADGDVPDATVPVYLVSGHPHIDGAAQSGDIYTMEPEPYVFFNRAVAEFVPKLDPAWRPDVVHANDWHTGILHAYLATSYRCNPTWMDATRIFTVHNLGHPGCFPKEVLDLADLPRSLYSFDRLEFFGSVSLLKAGLVCADRSNTVSRTYAEEVQTPEYGERMEGLLRYLAAEGRFTGILNGIDTTSYDPASDRYIPANYCALDATGKLECRRKLQQEAGLQAGDGPTIVGLVSRLSGQKGFDLIERAIADMLALDVQLVLLGAGEERYEQFLRDLGKQHRKRISVRIGFDEAYARRIYAGSDLFLMPSRFEPCGLGQLIALRYGTIPVVRATGGLADTIVDADAETRTGNGFVFNDYGAAPMMDAVKRAVAARADRRRWAGLVKRALKADFSWGRSARLYAELYRQGQARAGAEAA